VGPLQDLHGFPKQSLNSPKKQTQNSQNSQHLSKRQHSSTWPQNLNFQKTKIKKTEKTKTQKLTHKQISINSWNTKNAYNNPQNYQWKNKFQKTWKTQNCKKMEIFICDV